MRMRMHIHSTWTYGRGHGHAHVLERLAYHVCEDAADDVQQESGELQRDAGVDYGLGALGDGGADEDASGEHADDGREGQHLSRACACRARVRRCTCTGTGICTCARPRGRAHARPHARAHATYTCTSACTCTCHISMHLLDGLGELVVGEHAEHDRHQHDLDCRDRNADGVDGHLRRHAHAAIGVVHHARGLTGSARAFTRCVCVCV